MSKVRVYELAKEYGIKGPDLAKMLKELGFDGVKSHMAVLDDATEMHVRAVIEAQGMVGHVSAAPAEAEVATETAPGTLRKKALPGSETARKTLPELPERKRLPDPLRRERDQPKTLRKLAETVEEPASAASEAIAPPAEPITVTPQDSDAPSSAPQPVVEAPPVEPPPAEPVRDVPLSVEPVGGAAEAPPAPPVQETPPEAAEAEAAPSAEPAPTTAPAATPDAIAASGEVPAAEATEPAVEAPVAPKVRGIKRLLIPEAKATVLGRIELPPEAIRDAQRRSAPAPRNPGGVDRDLRRAALRSTQSRSAAPRPRVGPGMRRGPGATGGPGRGRPGQRGLGRRGGGSGLSSTVDPNKVVEIQPPITVKALSEALGVKVNDLIATLTFKLGVIGKNINSFLSNDEVELIALEVSRKIKIVERAEAEAELLSDLQAAHADIDSIPRAPVVTFMGHVDHGKTSLLDALRKVDVAVTAGEAGGITQHIGAYKVHWHDGTEFVVLDTPGHEAFTAMRIRGAKLTDIVVLVVAADDGVMPQTEEALAHALDAGVKVVVAINKCDRPDAKPMQVKQQLAVKGLQPEDWGGTIQMVEVSALTGAGLDDLVERIALEAELLDLTAKSDAPGEAIVIESRQSPEQGVIVNVLITNGTLRLRDTVLCGESLSRVRGLIDDHGRQLKEAGPSTPLSLVGLTSLPMPGDRLYVISDVKKAKEVAEERHRQARTVSLAERSKMTAESLRAQLEQRSIEEIKIILKADVMGSLEPIRQSLAKLNTDEVRVNVVHSALGGITETDVSLAEASGALVIGFNSVADTSARQAAERANVQIRFYEVIYALVDDVKLAMEGKLKPEEVEEVIGHAEIRAVFRSSKLGNIAGCYVTDGIVRRNAGLRLSRDGRVVHSGSLASLRREKDDVREAKSGFECGMVVKDFNDIKEGDQLEFFTIKYVKRTLA